MRMFDKIYWINSRNRVDRYLNMQKRLEGLDTERFEAILGGEIESGSVDLGDVKKSLNLPEIGCCMSHRAVWKLIKDNGFKKTLILEDDAFFNKSFEEIEHNYKAVPDDWQLLYFGQWNYDQNHDGKARALKEKISEGLYKAERCWLTHAYAVDISCIDILLNNSKKFYSTIDHILSDIQETHKVKTYAFFPDLIKQDMSKSSIR